MKCKIFRDFDTDVVTSVLNEQGQESSLYREALSQTRDQEEALDIWSASFLPGFIDYAKDITAPGTEPQLSDVLKYINNLNTRETLSTQDVVELTNNLQALNIESGDNLLNVLQRTFFNGQGMFEVNREKLKASALYTISEINNIMTFPSLRGNIKQFINKLRNTLRGDNQLQNIFTDNYPQTELSVQDSSQVLGIGKLKNYLPEEVRDYILTNVRNFNSDADFLSKIQALDNADIKDYILDNTEAFNYVKDMVNNSKVIPVFTELDGMPVPKLNNDLVPAILNTLRVGEDKADFTYSVDNLRVIPVDNWYGNEAVPILLKDIELQAAMNHVDVYGLSQSYNSNSREEILGILDVVDDFLYKAEQNTISNTDVYDLSNDISEFFQQNITQTEMTLPISETDKGRNISFIDSSLGEIELFQSGGYVKFRDNLYQKATVYDSFQDMVDETYGSLLEDITVLPDSVLEVLGLKTNGNYNLAYLLNPTNQANISGKINEFVSRQMDPNFTVNDNVEFDAAKQITLYKSLLRTPQAVTRKQDINDFMTRKSILDINDETIDYLTSDFISDFYSKYLQEKVLETPMFNSAYKYFEVTNRGIVFNNTNALIKNQVLTTMAEDELLPFLQAYSAISRDSSLEFLMPEQVDEAVIDIQDRRDFVINNPQSLEKFTKPYTKVDVSTIVIKNSKDEFVKLNDGIYELTDFRNGVSVYSKLNNVADPNYLVFNAAKPIVNVDVNAESFESTNSDLNMVDRSKVGQSETDAMIENMIC